ncbi:hypothetical protein TCSYLVIO_005052, partial [Trypanosoma cruzi]
MRLCEVFIYLCVLLWRRLSVLEPRECGVVANAVHCWLVSLTKLSFMSFFFLWC